MRRLAGVGLWIAAACFALACSRGAEAPRARFSVALLVPGSISDGGWNQGAYEGLSRIQRELGAEVSFVETKTPAEFEEAFRDYASRGFQLVFGHGFEYQEAAARVAPEFPRTLFVTTSGNTVLANVAPMVFELEQATYLCGVLAGRMSRSGKLGLIGGVDIPSIRSTFLAFEAGARSVRPDVVVMRSFLGNWEDTAAAREAAFAQIEEGADFILHNADAAGRGVLQAVAERAAAGAQVFAFGTNADQAALAPSVVIASAVLDIPAAFVEVAKRVRDGRFRAEPLRLGMREGIVRFAWNPRLRDRVPESIQAELARIEQRIRSGELKVPRGNF